jgi:hypothetical protein
MTWSQRLTKWMSSAWGGKSAPHQPPAITGQTQRFNRTLFVIAIIAVVALLVAQGPLAGDIRFVVWALTGALASAVVGAALGLLFGLPTVEAKREAVASVNAIVGQSDGTAASSTTTTQTEEGGSEVRTVTTQDGIETGYRESTSLEQIADWLTKIIVGLTLTQYATWEDRFQSLASSLTAAMMGAPPRDPMCSRMLGSLKGDDLLKVLDLPVCRTSPLPGGVIIALFATAGFLICYLWMRRYFILEMVIARREALERLRAKSIEIRETAEVKRRQVERKAEEAIKAEEEQKFIGAAREKFLAEETAERVSISDPQDQLRQIFARAEQRVGSYAPAHQALLAIRKRVEEETTDPDDPWRGKFGKMEAANGFRLEAKITPTENPRYFKVELAVQAEGRNLVDETAGTRVLYFLHPTFGDQPRVSTFGADGKAPLELYAYGAFTVGALLLQSGTTLELNLATNPDATERFRAQ